MIRIDERWKRMCKENAKRAEVRAIVIGAVINHDPAVRKTLVGRAFAAQAAWCRVRHGLWRSIGGGR